MVGFIQIHIIYHCFHLHRCVDRQASFKTDGPSLSLADLLFETVIYNVTLTTMEVCRFRIRYMVIKLS